MQALEPEETDRSRRRAAGSHRGKGRWGRASRPGKGYRNRRSELEVRSRGDRGNLQGARASGVTVRALTRKGDRSRGQRRRQVTSCQVGWLGNEEGEREKKLKGKEKKIKNERCRA